MNKILSLLLSPHFIMMMMIVSISASSSCSESSLVSSSVLTSPRTLIVVTVSSAGSSQQRSSWDGVRGDILKQDQQRDQQYLEQKKDSSNDQKSWGMLNGFWNITWAFMFSRELLSNLWSDSSQSHHFIPGCVRERRRHRIIISSTHSVTSDTCNDESGIFICLFVPLLWLFTPESSIRKYQVLHQHLFK